MNLIALPLFNSTRNFSRNLQLFEACNHMPTPEHPAVKAWLSGNIESTGRSIPLDIQKDATNVLSETGIDLRAFNDTLASIQRNASSARRPGNY